MSHTGGGRVCGPDSSNPNQGVFYVPFLILLVYCTVFIQCLRSSDHGRVAINSDRRGTGTSAAVLDFWASIIGTNPKWVCCQSLRA